MLYMLIENPAFASWLEKIGLGPLISVMFQIEFRAFFSVLLSFFIVLAFGRRTIMWLMRLKIGDAPEFYNADLNTLMANKKNVPTMGGILIVAAIAGAMLLVADLRNFYVLLSLVVLIWLACVGAADDWLKLRSARLQSTTREGLFAWEKLLFQLGLGLLVAIFLYIHSDRPEAHLLNLPFQRTYVPGTDGLIIEDGVIQLGLFAFAVIATLLIAGTSNAVNLTDGMDGLAAGTVVIAACTLMGLSYIAGSETAAARLYLPYVNDADEMMVLAGAIAGACLGFLWFNCLPAQVFMGDTGSLPLGGLLAYIAVAIRQEILLLVIGGVFFIEIGSVVLQVSYYKWTGGRRIFRVSPIHHHFQLGGWSEQQVVTRFWVLGVIFAMLALVSIKLR
ncbi:MAG: phospho-N-acetylmuramoyl-pentapeptide-transferase [Phycisphaerales bacterium]